MKRMITAGTSAPLMRSSDGLFELREESGIGTKNTPWTGLYVKSFGAAEKHVVEIRLERKGWQDYNGEPVRQKYRGVSVSHGMRSVSDTLDDTAEYIDVLESALDFAYEIEDFVKSW